MKNCEVLIVGYGSIGKRYEKYLSTMPNVNVSIVEIFSDARELAKSKNLDVYSKLEDNVFQKHYDYGIISNWGPDHVKTGNLLIKNSIKNITIEKPFCNNLYSGKKFLNKINELKIRCNVHFRWPYLGLLQEVKNLENEFDMGEASFINVLGGAGCLSTGGIHWMDFACRYFNESPLVISGVHGIENINPRSRDLGYVDGSCIYIFEDNKKLSFSLDNKSSIALETKFFYKYGYISIDANSQIRVFNRNKEDIELASKKITRYGIPEINKVCSKLQSKNTIEKVVNEMIGVNKKSDIVCNAYEGFRASKMLLLALESSRLRRQIDFNDLKDLNLNQCWSVS